MAMLRLLPALVVLAAAEWKCFDVNATNDPECYANIRWAILQGTLDHPDYYPNGTTTFVDFQCALFLKKDVRGDAADRAHNVAPAHNCTLPPCTAISAGMAAGSDEAKACMKPEPEADSLIEAEPEGPSMPWWGWILIVAGVLLAALATAFAMGIFRKAPQKKKRAVKMPVPEPEPVATTVTSAPAYDVAPAVYTYTAAPVYMATQSNAIAAPTVVTVPPVYMNGAPGGNQVMSAAAATYMPISQ
eukprot:TRINITY_DN25654_c0_g1_i1.p1 TRINITY_DN25654_c0_g1~~TRINITY_DN25654_c0_g1_i1.p1  ORF type:complete len:264 (-),score=49.92 TRINITY_DN25654_c0_g1_i1:418-1152(-)